MVEWSQVRDFKTVHTDHNFPNSYQEYLINHPLIVIKRFPISVIEIFLMSVRYLGLLLFLLPIWLGLKIKNNEVAPSAFPSIVVLLTIFSLALICIGTVENRWLASVYIMVLIMFSKKENFIKNILEEKHLMLNVILMDIVTLWALWKWKIFLNI